MKTNIAAYASILLALGIMGCGSSKDQGGATGDAQQASQTMASMGP